MDVKDELKFCENSKKSGGGVRGVRGSGLGGQGRWKEELKKES